MGEYTTREILDMIEANGGWVDWIVCSTCTEVCDRLADRRDQGHRPSGAVRTF